MSPNQQRQAGPSEVVPSTPPESEQEALPDISPADLRATGKYTIYPLVVIVELQ